MTFIELVKKVKSLVKYNDRVEVTCFEWNETNCKCNCDINILLEENRKHDFFKSKIDYFDFKSNCLSDKYSNEYYLKVVLK